MDRLESVRTFITVVVLGSFAQAAKALDVTPSVITKRLSELERRLGVKLLLRTTRRLGLTEEGTRYFEQAQRLLREFDQLDRTVSLDPDALHGGVRVACTTSLGVGWVGRELCRLRERHPGLVFELILIDRSVDLLAENFDLVVTDKPFPVGGSLTELVLCRNDRVVCASPGYLRRRGTPHEPADLAAHDCIHYSFLPGGTDWVFHTGERGSGPEVVVRVTPVLSASNAQVIRASAVADGGVAILPLHVAAPDLAEGRLMTLLPEHRLPDFWVKCILPPLSRQTSRVGAVVDHLRQVFGGHPPWLAPSTRDRN